MIHPISQKSDILTNTLKAMKWTYIIQRSHQFPRQAVLVEGEGDLPNVIQQKGGAQNGSFIIKK